MSILSDICYGGLNNFYAYAYVEIVSSHNYKKANDLCNVSSLW